MFIPLYWGPNLTPNIQFLLVQNSVFLKQIVKKVVWKHAEFKTEILGVGIGASEIK